MPDDASAATREIHILDLKPSLTVTRRRRTPSAELRLWCGIAAASMSAAVLFVAEVLA